MQRIRRALRPAGPAPGSSAAAQGAGRRHRLHRRSVRHHRDQLPRRRQGRLDHRHPGGRPQAAGQAAGRRREDRSRRAQGRERQAAALRRVRRRQQGARRPVGDGGRQPVRPRRHRDDRHRVGARPRHPVGSVRRLHPDRRRDQPRQLGWPAVRHGRQGHRHQHRDLLADRRQRSGLASPSRRASPSRWWPSSRIMGGSSAGCWACRSSR